MKTLIRIMIGFCFTACAALAGTELAPVSFVIGKQQFKPGDSIVLDQVLATSWKFEVGTKVLVRGHYRLASAEKAALGLFVTHSSPSNGEKVTPEQMKRVERPTGEFELSCEILAPGDVHVSFYPADQGESFGGVYFAPSAPKA